MSGRGAAAAGVAVALVALGVRCVGLEEVFVGDGGVVFRLGDGHSHVRRAAVTFFAFPRVLAFDPYLNHPDGAAVPSPPLYDAALGAGARLLGRSRRALELAAAWAAPLLGALAVWPVMAAARGLGGTGPAVGAGLLYALFPVIALVSRVGEADHHAAISALGAAWLAASLAALRARGRRLAGLAVALALLRTAMVLTWGGSLAYSAVADGTLLLAAAATRRRDLLLAVGLGAAATAAAVAPVVAALPVPAWGPWSTGALSWMHPAFAGATAAVALLAAALERPRAAPGERDERSAGGTGGALAGVVRLAAAGVAVAGVLWVLPGPREGLLGGLGGGLGFVGSAGGGGVGRMVIAELLALYPGLGRPAIASPAGVLGAYAYLVPAAPLLCGLVALDPARRGPALVLAGWTAAFGALFVLQYRFGAEFAAPGAVAFAVGIGEAARRGLGARLARLRRPAAAAVGALLLAPALPVHAGALRASLAALGDGRTSLERMLATPAGTLTHFLREVRRATPETRGWLGDARPSYGILCRSALGHGLQYVARRASPASGYMHLAGREQLEATAAFFAATDEREALEIARRLRTPYVATATYPGMGGATLEARLHLDDGRGSRRTGPSLGHLRLVTEAPASGRPLSDVFDLLPSAGRVPFKLFEIVPAALLEVRARPGERVEATVALRSPAGRAFDWETAAVAGADGVARLRVPYATVGATPGAPAEGPYSLRVGETMGVVAVNERDVQEGRRLPVDLRPPRRDPAGGQAGRREGAANGEGPAARGPATGPGAPAAGRRYAPPARP